MSELMGNIEQHVLKENIMKDEFGWEIPVETVPSPSQGRVYDADSVLYRRETVKIKAMTAREEDILSSKPLLIEGTAVDYLIRSCLIDKKIDVNNLITGDKNAIMISIRITGYGTDYHVKSVCDNCDHNEELIVDLSSLSIKRLGIVPVDEGKNRFLFNLPVTKKKIIFKFLNTNDERRRERTIEFMKEHTGNIENNITSFLEESIISVEGITDKNKIKHFINNMPALDAKKLRRHIWDNEPGIDMTHEWNCAKCSHKNKGKLPINSEFFWPTK